LPPGTGFAEAGGNRSKEMRMQPFPHHYSACALANPQEDVTLRSSGLQPLRSAAPAEFDGPGDRWSPETLIVGAIADCYILTFRSLARAARLPFISLSCSVDGTLDRIDRAAQFTAFTVHAKLRVAAGTDEEQARRLLEKAEQSCLISNSLKAAPRLEADIEFVAPAEPVAACHQGD
jgi:peroxiredoxin-like protein